MTLFLISYDPLELGRSGSGDSIVDHRDLFNGLFIHMLIDHRHSITGAEKEHAVILYDFLPQ